MKPEHTERLRAVRALIDSDWGYDHFNLSIEIEGDLHEAFERDKIGCGAAGCVVGFLPLVNPRVVWNGRWFSTPTIYHITYIHLAQSEDGFGLSNDEAHDLCSPLEYSPRWTRSEVLRRIDRILAGKCAL